MKYLWMQGNENQNHFEKVFSFYFVVFKRRDNKTLNK